MIKITPQRIKSESGSDSNRWQEKYEYNSKLDQIRTSHQHVPINSFQNFNLTFLVENDSDFNNFIKSTLPRPQLKSSAFEANFPGSSAKADATAKKFLTLKQMIMFFQNTPTFGKFSYYGCWCFPDGANDITSGYGEPVDDIDKTCKRMNQCYKCAQMRYGKKECPINTEYTFKGLEDPVTGRRYVDCLDEEGTCSRSMCECDKKMASGIAGLEDEWDKAYHSRWSSFERARVCKVNTRDAFGLRYGGHSRGGGNNQPDACCGEEGEKFPYNSDGGRRGCCDGRTYNRDYMKCCPRDGVKSLESKCL